MRMLNRVKCRRFIKRVIISMTIFVVMFFQVFSISERPTDDFNDVRAGPGVGQLERPDIFNFSVRYFNESTVNVTNIRQYDKRKLTSVDESGKCIFSGSFEDNIKKLKSINFKTSNTWTHKLGFDRLPKNRTTSLPVLVSGANARFFDVIQGLVKSVHEKLLPKYPTLKFIVYDMGFTESQNKRLRKYCRCEVRRLPFEDLPGHVKRLTNFAFKPIIINYVFQEFGHAWWVDSSVRFTTSDLDRALTYLDENGALFFTYGSTLNVALHTHIKTFQHFDEDPCPYMYFGEVEAGNVAFINNEVGSVILNRWVSCALDASCLAPVSFAKRCPNEKHMTAAKIGACHRFDQSVLSIILRRLYHQQNDYPLVEEPIRIIVVKRGHKVDYFPNE